MAQTLLTTREVERKLNVCRQTLLRWRDPVNGLDFPEPVQIDGDRRPNAPNLYDEAEIDDWYERKLKRHKLTPRPPSNEGK
jgi:predicted DNA-binding transcriptional regulator AlpA